MHRRLALLKVYGEESTAAVDLRKYKSDAELYMEAVALNSAHGRPLSRQDQTRIVLRLREFGVETQKIAMNLHIPEPTVEKLAMRIVMDVSGASVPAKRGLEHMHGQQFTQQQMAAMSSVRSAEVGRLCIELRKLLEAELVDLSDEQTVRQLVSLSEAIAAAIKPMQVSA